MFWLILVVSSKDNKPHDHEYDKEGGGEGGDNDGVEEDALEIEIDTKQGEEDGGGYGNGYQLQHGHHQPGQQQTAGIWTSRVNQDSRGMIPYLSLQHEPIIRNMFVQMLILARVRVTIEDCSTFTMKPSMKISNS